MQDDKPTSQMTISPQQADIPICPKCGTAIYSVWHVTECSKEVPKQPTDYERGILEERERCLKIAEAFRNGNPETDLQEGLAIAAEEIAKRIRSGAHVR